MTQEELINVFKYVVKKCDTLINNGNYEADAHTQNTVEDIAELCNHVLDGDYGKLNEVPVSKNLEEASKKWLRPQLDKSYENCGEVKMMELTHFDGYAMLDAIEFGAKWQKEEMMKDAIPATVFCESLKIPTIGQFLHKTNLKENDKVKVIIIKED